MIRERFIVPTSIGPAIRPRPRLHAWERALFSTAILLSAAIGVLGLGALLDWVRP